jgi:hypothetical protein
MPPFRKDRQPHPGTFVNWTIFGFLWVHNISQADDIGVADTHMPILGLLMQPKEETLSHPPAVLSQEKRALSVQVPGHFRSVTDLVISFEV